MGQRTLTVIFAALVTILCFQNCAAPMDEAELQSEQGTGPDPDPDPDPNPDPLMSLTSYIPASSELVGGGTLTIYGANLTNTDLVAVDGVACTPVTWVSANEIRCPIPSSATVKTANITVTRADASEPHTLFGFQYVNTVVVQPDPCTAASTTKVTFSKAINFPSTTNLSCGWGLEGNLNPNSGNLAARIEQWVDFNLPPGAIVCSAAARFNQTNVYIDDAPMLMFNNLVVFGRYAAAIPKLTTTAAGYKAYNWLAIRGVSTTQGTYCAPGGTCTYASAGGENYNFDIKIPGPLIKAGVKARTASGLHRFKLMVGGDNNSTDCRHSAITGSISLVYDMPH